jgi:peptide/nickel transport system substrate-binding protein
VAIPEHLFHYTNAMIDPEEGGRFGAGSNGTGPFELADVKVGQKAVLKARGDYYLDGPYLDAVEFIDLGDDPSASLAALASKQVHILTTVEQVQLKAVESLPHVVVQEAHTANTAVVQMMIDKKPLDDPRVTTAIRHATDSRQVVDFAARGYGLPGEHHFVAPIHPEYAKLPDMHDPDKAKALLAEAGHPDGIDLDFYCKKDPAWELLAVQNLVEQWKPVGIRAEIKVLPSAQFWEVWDKETFAFVSWGHRPLGTMVLALGFRSGVPWNPTAFADEEFDALLTKAEGTLDVDERREIMAEVETIMQQRGPIAQPLWTDALAASDKRVHEYRPHPFGFVFVEEVALEA